jgi:hypothetical protein
LVPAFPAISIALAVKLAVKSQPLQRSIFDVADFVQVKAEMSAETYIHLRFHAYLSHDNGRFFCLVSYGGEVGRKETFLP